MGVGVEVENWVEPSRPRNEREKLHDFIVQEGLLQLQPPVGSLGPGESTTWTITYRQAFDLPENCTIHIEWHTCAFRCYIWHVMSSQVMPVIPVAVGFS